MLLAAKCERVLPCGCYAVCLGKKIWLASPGDPWVCRQCRVPTAGGLGWMPRHTHAAWAGQTCQVMDYLPVSDSVRCIQQAGRLCRLCLDYTGSSTAQFDDPSARIASPITVLPHCDIVHASCVPAPLLPSQDWNTLSLEVVLQHSIVMMDVR